jgi:hypothetical protein
VILAATAERKVVWIANPDENARTLLAHRAMTRLAAAQAEAKAAVEDWRDLTDRERGACIVIDRRVGTVSVAGSAPLQIGIGGRLASLAPDSAERFAPGEAIVLPATDGRPAIVLT